VAGKTMPPPKPRVLIDADVLFAGVAAPSEHGASLVTLRMAEITLIEALTSQQVIDEAERNLADKLPAALPTFRLLVSRCLRVEPDLEPSDVAAFEGLAHPKDAPILAAAVRYRCLWMVTFNVRHYQPGHPAVTVLTPGQLVLRVRDQLAHLDQEEGA
jgi:predicted nucleic acid-binding protein